MLDYVDDKIECYSHKEKVGIEVAFFEANIIRGTDSEASAVKIIKKPQLFKKSSPVQNDNNSNITAQAQFNTDSKGFVTIRNVPNDKSSVYFIQLNEKFQEEDSDVYSSSEARIIFDYKTNIYIVYDNVNKKAHRGKVNTKTGLLQPPTVIHNLYYSQVEGINGSHFKLDSIKSASFLPSSDTVLIIDEKLNFLEYNHLNGSLRLVTRKINKVINILKNK